MSRLCKRRGVDDDIYDVARYLLDQSEDAARRFVDAVQLTLKDLAGRPGIGSLKRFQDPLLADVRTWWVKGFPNHLIYYIAMADGIDVLAVMHGSRDAEALLGDRVA